MQTKNITWFVVIVLALAIGFVGGYMVFSARSGTADVMPANNEPSNEIWTCSMHPQIRQNEPGECPICGMDLIPASSAANGDPLVLEMTEEAVKLAQIETFIVGVSDGEAHPLRLSGKIKPDESLTASQVAHIPGRIEKLYVTFTGEQVESGQELAVIYSPQLISTQQELIEAYKLKDQNPALLQAARKRLEYWKISPEVIAEIETTGEIRETLTIYAEVDGIVQKRHVAVGDYVGQGEVLFEIVSLDKLWIIFDAYEDDLPSIREGDLVEFTTRSAPGKTFRTRVSFIDPLIDPQTRSASVRAELQNTNRTLKPEMFVHGQLFTRRRQADRITVPRSAVLWTGKRSVVYVRVPETEVPSYRFQEVALGSSMGDSYVIEEGLSVGDEVVVNGAFAIDAASQLNNQSSMMNRNVRIRGRDHAHEHPDFKETTPGAFRDQLTALAHRYLDLKNALVETKADQAVLTAGLLLDQVDQVDMLLLEGESHEYWMEQMSAIRAHTKNIANLSDVEDQRAQFEFVSDAVIASLQSFGASDTFYVQHCPMAFDNDGANWLSGENEVLNPYFGERMLKCGITTDTLTDKK